MLQTIFHVTIQMSARTFHQIYRVSQATIFLVFSHKYILAYSTQETSPLNGWFDSNLSSMKVTTLTPTLYLLLWGEDAGEYKYIMGWKTTVQ